jgi:uncharacterized protein (DUF58 family)
MPHCCSRASAAHAGDRVDLLAVGHPDPRERLPPPNKRGLRELIGALAPLQPALVETDFGRVVAEVLDRERKARLVVLFTTLDPGALGEGLLPCVCRAWWHATLVMVAAVHDQALDDLATALQATAAIHTAAAAERGLAELRRVRAALGRTAWPSSTNLPRRSRRR